MNGGHGRANLNRSTPDVKNIKGTTIKLLKYLKPFKRGLIMVIVLVVLSTLFSILGPRILGYAVDILYKGITAKLNHTVGAAIDMKGIFNVLLVLLTVYLLSAILSYIQEFKMAGISQNMLRRMRNDVDEKLHRLPLNYFDTKSYGDILSRVTNDIDTIGSTFENSLVQIITSTVTLIGITVMMFTISPLLSLVAIMILPLSGLLTAFIAKRTRPFFTGQQVVLGEINGYIEEMYAGHTVVTAYNYEKRSVSVFNKKNKKLFNFAWKAQFSTSIIYPLLNFMSNTAFIAVCVLGGYLTAIGNITLGGVQAFISYSRQFSQPIMQVASIMNIFMSTIAAAERVFEVLEEVEEPVEIKNPKTINEVKGSVRFDNISFRYIKEKPLIENLTIDVLPGKVVAIAGPTGAGKSTLVNLLMRFYDPQKGKITIDSVNIAEMSREYLHGLIGMVLQDTWLFNGTIAQNIAYGRENATQEEIVRAAQIAYADTFIRTLPQGYETIINEEADNISQGQKQLLTIARAIIANPRILILDEATSSIDTRTEVLIQKAMSRLMKGRTSFVIAHRLSTIEDADIILVLDHGNIIEQGNHQELLNQKGFYNNLYQSQFSVG